LARAISAPVTYSTQILQLMAAQRNAVTLLLLGAVAQSFRVASRGESKEVYSTTYTPPDTGTWTTYTPPYTGTWTTYTPPYTGTSTAPNSTTDTAPTPMINRESCCAGADEPAKCEQVRADGFNFVESVNGDTSKTIMQCPNRDADDPCGFDNCVGPIGVDCQGVEQDICFGFLGCLPINLVSPIDNGDGTSTIKTAVGSILHDLCCIEHPDGAFCGSYNYPIGATLNLLGNTNNNCNCLLEWRKAAWNLLRGRYWEERVPNGKQTADLTPDTSTVRYSWLPVSSGSEHIGPSHWGIVERKATSSLCAPSGTQLDCPNNDDNCRVSSCNDTTCAHAGDADYCCSGRFRLVLSDSDGQRYGECA